MYLQDGERVVVVASKGGMDQHPLWYLNVSANPDVEVQIGNDVRAMRAHTADDAERAELWPKLVAMYRDYDDSSPRRAQVRSSSYRRAEASCPPQVAQKGRDARREGASAEA